MIGCWICCWYLPRPSWYSHFPRKPHKRVITWQTVSDITEQLLWLSVNHRFQIVLGCLDSGKIIFHVGHAMPGYRKPLMNIWQRYLLFIPHTHDIPLRHRLNPWWKLNTRNYNTDMSRAVNVRSSSNISNIWRDSRQQISGCNARY